MACRSRAARYALSLVLLLTLTTLPSYGQLISVKSVPVASGDQFLLHPSKNLGMGGVTIAVDDPWYDPFVNPAKASRQKGAVIFSAPTFYNVTNRNGAARTLPVTALVGSDAWFGGLSLSIQELRAPEGRQRDLIRPADAPATGFIPSPPEALSERSATNTYVHGLVGRRLPGSSMSVAASVALADLNGVDGVEHLYARSDLIDQFGHLLDLRLGLLNDTDDGRTFEALLLHNRFATTHDVTYITWFWDPVVPEEGFATRTERHLDRTNTWGAHLQYVQPITESGWRLGGVATANFKSHPKIPNYELMNIPRDPGNSWAYNFGLGLSRTEGPATFGVDAVYEPIWSSTWAETDVPVERWDGRTIPAGGKTVENDFRFSNALMRIGLTREGDRFGMRMGLQLRSISYRLKQYDNVAGGRRHQTEHWMEWTPTWGAGLKFKEFEVRYSGRWTTGTGLPGVAWTGRDEQNAAGSDFVIAPSGPLTLQEASVITHQVSVAVPIR